MNPTLALGYGVFCYAVFFPTFCYAAGFVGNYWVPKGIDDGAAGAMGASILVNVLMLGLFAVQHSVMARPEFKEKWTKIVPAPIERATFVLLTSLILILMFWQWRAMPTAVWDIQNGAARAALHGLYFAGFGIVLISTFLIDHFELFGLAQVIRYFKGKEAAPPAFLTPLFYKYVRHPLMSGFILAFWSAPTMSQGRLLFCVVTTVYILVALQIEERDLVKFHGDDYRNYQKTTPMLLPIPKGK